MNKREVGELKTFAWGAFLLRVDDVGRVTPYVKWIFSTWTLILAYGKGSLEILR